jgi:hypothetical protein
VAIARDGSFPVYVSLCHQADLSLCQQAGLLAGWLNLAGGVPSGSLTWLRPVWISPAGQSETPPDQQWLSHVLRLVMAPDLSSTSLRLSQ